MGKLPMVRVPKGVNEAHQIERGEDPGSHLSYSETLNHVVNFKESNKIDKRRNKYFPVKMGVMTRSMTRNFIKKRSMDFVHEKPRKKARRALVEYYERDKTNYAFTFIYILLVGFTCIMFSYAVILAVV